jgi:hypothetical protein
LVWLQGVATMTLYRLLTYLKTSFVKGYFLSVTTTLQRLSRQLLDYTNESIYSVYQNP